MRVDTPISLTESAARRLLRLIQIENDPNLKFRVYITGGGCSGFQYGFAFEKENQPDDIIVDTYLGAEEIPLQIVIDPMSMTYLDGAVVEYQEGLYGSHFTIKNPNAKNTCGCGNSFSL
ncbi:MAG TPA: iron-sulfur cluster insertion protein ErpA [Gammaproteobacteria bacterium]|nr:iron-sulfur cluster insertion protein ErpA [Gammaproteobacteria bacterium]